MFDPVNVSSGHTFERTSVQICKDLSFVPILSNGTAPSFSGSVNPNAVIRSKIQRWCDENDVVRPSVVDYYAVEETVRSLIAEADANLYKPPTMDSDDDDEELLERIPHNPILIDSHAVTLPHMRRSSGQFDSGGSSSPFHHQRPETPMNFKTTPASYAVSPQITAEEIELNPRNWELESDRLLWKLMSSDVREQVEGVITLRNLTRTDDRTRASLCTPRMLSVIRPLILSSNETVQVNAVASLVNVSLERLNKAKIVAAGLIPPLIQILKHGFQESQEHAAGAIFSLSLEEENQTAIGVLGGLEPLLNSIKSESDRTRHDSALALYHLSLNHTNRVRLVNLNAVAILLKLLKVKNMLGRVILVLCNLAQCAEGKAAMLDGNAVMEMVRIVRDWDEVEEVTLGNVVATLCALSQGSLRFKGLAMDAGAVDVLRGVEVRARSERTRERARRVLVVLRGMCEDNEDEEGGRRMFESGGTMSVTRVRRGVNGGDGRGRDLYTVKTTKF